jgi:hypothetical protein
VCCIASESVRLRACGKTSGGLENLCSNVRALPFISSRGACTLSGTLIGGSGDILNNVYIGALNALDPEIFLISLRMYAVSRYGLVLSC